MGVYPLLSSHYKSAVVEKAWHAKRPAVKSRDGAQSSQRGV